MSYFVYQRGHFPRETLATLWRIVEEEGAAGKLFYAQPLQDTPIDVIGDLVTFVNYFEDPKRHLLIVEDKGAPVGLVWFDDIVPGHRAAINAFYRRRYWGHPARAATIGAMKLAFEAMGIQAIWAYTPWPEAVKHAEAVGMRQVARLEEFVLINGQPRDIIILKLQKGDAQWAKPLA